MQQYNFPSSQPTALCSPLPPFSLSLSLSLSLCLSVSLFLSLCLSLSTCIYLSIFPVPSVSPLSLSLCVLLQTTPVDHFISLPYRSFIFLPLTIVPNIFFSWFSPPFNSYSTTFLSLYITPPILFLSLPLSTDTAIPFLYSGHLINHLSHLPLIHPLFHFAISPRHSPTLVYRQNSDNLLPTIFSCMSYTLTNLSCCHSSI